MTGTSKAKPKRPQIAPRTIFTGDNLEVLSGINTGTVDLMYLDPPFNSNRTYSAPVGSKAAGAAFKDTWTLSDLDRAEVGLLAEAAPEMASYIRAAGKVHGPSMMSYLTMMATRLLEMRRVLKLSGSIYLHCDDTAGSYLRVLMDSVFGTDRYRNEITWRRTSTVKTAGDRFARDNDTILFYSGGSFEPQWAPLSEGGLKPYRHEDEHGLYRWVSVGDTRNGYFYDLGRGETPPKHGYRMPESRARQWMDAGLLDVRPNRVPRRKRYLSESKGAQVSSTWTDIGNLQSQSPERVGYPTQKPLALMERIIAASSNPGDMVLDPFCGCATTCIAAEKLHRDWIGIDLSPKAVELVGLRMEKDLGLFSSLVVHRDDLPRRTDVEVVPDYRTNKRELYGAQEGDCAGCGIHFPFKNLTVDHIVPKSKAGTDHIDNLQLLCGHCNSVKGTGTMAEFRAKLAST